MLVQNSIYRNTYLTDGVNKDFYFSFPILEASQVLVQTSRLTDTDTVTTVDPSQYTVTGAGQVTGGHISFTTAPSTGSRIALTLNMPITQLYQYAELDSFPAKSHEDALAKLTLICQQLKEQISRAVLISTTSEGSTADSIASLYAARDSATTSATAADLSATSAGVSATSAGASATAAQQSADSAAANSEGLAAEVQNLSTMLIGSVQSLLCADGYVPNGCVPTNGAEYTASQFPSFYTDYLVAGKIVTCTYTEFAAQVALTGNCGKFALDTVNQKFKVPVLKDGDSITQASSAAELGKSVKAGLPNATGTFGYTLGADGVSGGLGVRSGIFKEVSQKTALGGGGGAVAVLDLDLSRSNSIYGNSTTVTPEQIRLRHFVVVASAQNNQSVFDWSAYMSALAGKANADLSNVVLQPSMTGSATLNGTTDNTVQLPDIVTTLGLEVGDVIRIQYSGYDKLHSVESITNNNLIVVNYEHAGNRGNGSLKLANQTASATITRIAKWYNAPSGLGVAPVSFLGKPTLRAANTVYINTTNRMINVKIAATSGGTAYVSPDGVSWIGNFATASVTGMLVVISLDVPPSWCYRTTTYDTREGLGTWVELR